MNFGGGFPFHGQMQPAMFDINMWNHGGMSPAFYHQTSYPHMSNGMTTGPMPVVAPSNATPDVSGEQISGMTPLVFSGMRSNAGGVQHTNIYPPHNGNAMSGMRNVMNSEGQIYQVVSTDSQMDYPSGVASSAPVQMQMPVPPMMVFQSGMSGIPLQQPKKWVRWSEQEDICLRRAVQTYGEHNFKGISEHIFHGARSEVQCKNRWKKVRV